MAAKPMSKTKIVSHLAEKTGTPKKVSALFFDELFKLAVKECKGAAGKFVIPNIGRAVKAHRKARMGRIPSSRRFLAGATK
jgi:nucleoid DNA-binding protein